MHLGPVAVVGRVELEHLVALVDVAHDAEEKAFHSSKYSGDALLLAQVGKLPKVPLVVLRDGMSVVEGPKGARVLVVGVGGEGFVKVVRVELGRMPRGEALTLGGERYTRLTDSVLTARGVMIVQTVGLSKPVSLAAPFISIICKLLPCTYL